MLGLTFIPLKVTSSGGCSTQGGRGGSGLRALYSVSIPVAQPDNMAVQNCRVPWGADGSTSDTAPYSSQQPANACNNYRSPRGLPYMH